MKSNIDQIKTQIIPVLKKAGVKRSSIFGSYARGEETKESDVDILVDFPREKSLFDFVGLKLDLEDVLKRKVDLVEYSAVKPRIKDQILSDQIVIL